VDTGPKIDAGWMAEIQSPNWEFGRGYHPAPPESLRSAISNLEIDCSQFCFIDFGSGKGRSLFVASDFPFREIVGVEFSASLHDVAVANVKTYQNEEQKCFEIVPVLEDAAAYEIPVRPTVFYLYDPFGEPVISEVFANIIKAIEDCDQACYVIYFNPVFAEKFEEHELFERIDAGKEFLNYWDRTRNGNKDANEFTSEVCDGERFVVYRSVR
jgi:SAM-dependent methyltransferase